MLKHSFWDSYKTITEIGLAKEHMDLDGIGPILLFHHALRELGVVLEMQ